MWEHGFEDIYVISNIEPRANKTIKKLQALNIKYETEKQNLFEAMNASKEDFSAYKDEKLKPLIYLWTDLVVNSV